MSRGVLGACFIALAITASAVAEDAMEISVQDVSISVVESGGRVANELELAYPSRAPRRLRLDPTQTLKVGGVQSPGQPSFVLVVELQPCGTDVAQFALFELAPNLPGVSISGPT